MKKTKIAALAAASLLAVSAVPNVSALTPPYTLPEEVTLFGDVNGDESVSGSDVLSFIGFFLSSKRSWDGASPYAEANSDKIIGNIWAFNADLDRDGKLTVMDLATLKQYAVGDTVPMGGKSFNAEDNKSDVKPLLRAEKTFVIPCDSICDPMIYATESYENALTRLEELDIKKPAAFDDLNLYGSPFHDIWENNNLVVIVPCENSAINPDKINEDMSYEQGTDMGELWMSPDGIELCDNTGNFNCVKIFVYNSSAYYAISRIIGFTDSSETVRGFRNGMEIDSPMVDRKPVIYLYPEEETDVHVELDYNGILTYTYPKYSENGWDVTAQPDGTLTDKDGYEYSYLFWEGISDTAWDMSEGFVVKGEDTASFLREKLSYMGLTPREYNEFIVYWLPEMEGNNYNLITFQQEQYTESAKLDITPAPDSMQRVFMTFKSLDEYTDIPEQELPTFERKGFSVVEWGGTEVR